MMVGSRYYSDADMMRMTRDAEARVAEMQNRARRAAQEAGDSVMAPPLPSRNNRNWNTSPNLQRARLFGQPQNPPPQEAPPVSAAPAPAAPETPAGDIPPPGTPPAPVPDPPSSPAPEAAQEEQKTTIVEDLVGALNIESDTLLIIGLILILLNQKADTTLILALAYLLI